MKPIIQETLVGRLLCEYHNAIVDNWNLYFEEDISREELEIQLCLVGGEYVARIVAAMG